MGDEAFRLTRAGFIDGADERVVNGGLGADVSEEGLALAEVGEFDDDDLAADGGLLGEPGGVAGVLGEGFEQAVVAELTVFHGDQGSGKGGSSLPGSMGGSCSSPGRRGLRGSKSRGSMSCSRKRGSSAVVSGVAASLVRWRG